MNTKLQPFTKVYLRKPPEIEPSSHWERYPTLVTVEKYSKSGIRAYVRMSYFPRTKLVSVNAEALATQDEWRAANEKWAMVHVDKAKYDAIKSELLANAPAYPIRKIFKSGVDANDINVAMTCLFGDDSIYREPNPDYQVQLDAWDAYWMMQNSEFRPNGVPHK